MNLQTRDMIIVTGPSASGKTKALSILRAIIPNEYEFPYEPVPLSDSHTILKQVREDDRSGGHNHYHPWEGGGLGHTHEQHDGITPFTLAGKSIGFNFMRDFFVALKELPHDGKIKCAEWSGGRNGNEPEDPASRTDIAFSTIVEQLKTWPSEGLDRVMGILHISTDRDIRFSQNKRRSTPTDEQIRLGLASWELSPTAMLIFDKDDFPSPLVWQYLGCEHHIPFMRTIFNDGKDSLETGIRAALPRMFEIGMGKEMGKSYGKER
ncbi:MAG: hypothetical protein WAV51_00915 [Microgenomates group bacterium]